jgi:hypothetical protein
MRALAFLAGGVTKAVAAVPVATVAAVALKGVIVASGVSCGILLVCGAVKMVRDGTAEECLKTGAGLLAALHRAAAGS